MADGSRATARDVLLRDGIPSIRGKLITDFIAAVEGRVKNVKTVKGLTVAKLGLIRRPMFGDGGHHVRDVSRTKNLMRIMGGKLKNSNMV